MKHDARRSVPIILCSIVLFLAAGGAFADSTHTIRAYAGYFTSSGDKTLNLGKVEFDNTAGFGVGYEYQPSKWWGIAADYGRFGTDIKASNVGKTSGDFDPATLGVNFHIVPLKTVNIYVGPEAAYIRYGRPHFDVPGVGTVNAKIDNELTWGAKAGVDFHFLPFFGVGASVEYIDASAELKTQSEKKNLDPKPVIVHGGLFFRF